MYPYDDRPTPLGGYFVHVDVSCLMCFEKEASALNCVCVIIDRQIEVVGCGWLQLIAIPSSIILFLIIGKISETVCWMIRSRKTHLFQGTCYNSSS
jgi:hypothetical protein